MKCRCHGFVANGRSRPYARRWFFFGVVLAQALSVAAVASADPPPGVPARLTGSFDVTWTWGWGSSNPNVGTSCDGASLLKLSNVELEWFGSSGGVEGYLVTGGEWRYRTKWEYRSWTSSRCSTTQDVTGSGAGKLRALPAWSHGYVGWLRWDRRLGQFDLEILVEGWATCTSTVKDGCTGRSTTTEHAWVPSWRIQRSDVRKVYGGVVFDLNKSAPLREGWERDGWEARGQLEGTTAESGSPSGEVEVIVMGPVNGGWLEDLFIDPGNPGHVALRVGQEMFNYGPYWPDRKSGVLCIDDFDTYIAAQLVKRSYIVGFTVKANEVDTLVRKVYELYNEGTPNPGFEGRKIDEYSPVFGVTCVGWTRVWLDWAGVRPLPDAVRGVISPNSVRDAFLEWREQSPDKVTKVTYYKGSG